VTFASARALQSTQGVYVLKPVLWLLAAAAVVAAAALLRVDRLAAPSTVDRIHEIARLEVLEVTVHRKATFAPGPEPHTTFLADVVAYARDTVAPRRGKAIVFADARFYVDLRKARISADGDHVSVTLPEPEVQASLLPAETEIIASNLDSAQTAQLLDEAQGELRSTVASDAALRRRAHEAAVRTVSSLVTALGFHDVLVQ
jgi:hypothetical protein